jgi:hypothetical protein
MLENLKKTWNEYQERAQLRKWCNSILNEIKENRNNQKHKTFNFLDFLQGCIVKLYTDFTFWQMRIRQHYSNRDKTGGIETVMISIIELWTCCTYLALMGLGCYALIWLIPIITPEITMKAVLFAYPLSRLHNAMLRRFNEEVMPTDCVTNKTTTPLISVLYIAWFTCMTTAIACYAYITPGHFINFVDLSLVSSFWIDQIVERNEKTRRLTFIVRLLVSMAILTVRPANLAVYLTGEILPMYAKYIFITLTHVDEPVVNQLAHGAKYFFQKAHGAYSYATTSVLLNAIGKGLRLLLIPAIVMLTPISIFVIFSSNVIGQTLKASTYLLIECTKAKNPLYSVFQNILITNFAVAYLGIASNNLRHKNLLQQINVSWAICGVALWCLTPGNGLQYVFSSCAALTGITLLHQFASKVSETIHARNMPMLLKNIQKDDVTTSDRGNLRDVNTNSQAKLLSIIAEKFLRQAVLFISERNSSSPSARVTINFTEPATVAALEKDIRKLETYLTTQAGKKHVGDVANTVHNLQLSTR